MNVRRFLSVVPKPVKTMASIIMSCGVLIGPIAAFVEGRANGRIAIYGASLPILTSLGHFGFGLLVGIAVGAVIALWVLCLGYVYGDARRRSMPPLLWTLVAFLVPNLLGFLLYFAMRRPILSLCTHCGQVITAEHRFCPWCGRPELSATFDKIASSGLDSTAAI